MTTAVATWLIDETRPPDAAEIEPSLHQPAFRGRGPGGRKSALAVRLGDITIHDTKKWFGGADIRLDAIVVQGILGNGDGEQPFYHPSTFRFPSVRDGDRLPIDEPGLLVFYGWPAFFIDISILVSRDQKDSEDLGKLVASRANSSEWKTAAASLLSLATTAAAPQVAAVTAALGGAATIGSFAAEVLRQVTGNTIGLYRVSWLQHRDRFGLGRHPAAGVYRALDFSFWYNIEIDRTESGRTTG